MELLSVINFIGLIYLLIVVHSLKSSLQSQTKPLTSQRKKETIDEVPVYHEAETTWKEHDQDAIQKFFTWFARDWPLKVGALFILLGFVWLVTYAFLNNWIGETGRIVFGILAGSAILMWGSTRIKLNVYQGEILTAGGNILLYTYWAEKILTRTIP